MAVFARLLLLLCFANLFHLSVSNKMSFSSVTGVPGVAKLTNIIVTNITAVDLFKLEF